MSADHSDLMKDFGFYMLVTDKRLGRNKLPQHSEVVKKRPV